MQSIVDLTAVFELGAEVVYYCVPTSLYARANLIFSMLFLAKWKNVRIPVVFVFLIAVFLNLLVASNPCGELITLGLCLERSILRAHGAVCFQS